MSGTRRLIAVIPAAGVGARMGAAVPKQYLQIGGKTVLEHSIWVFLQRTDIEKIIVAVSPNDPYYADIALLQHPKITLVQGGENRADSVLNGLNAISDDATSNSETWVLVHDAARPCLTQADLDKLLAVADADGAILAIPATDTVKRATACGRIAATENRDTLWLAQTPQFFPVQQLRQALTAALAQGVAVTDEASAVEWAGGSPRLIEGRRDNLKITRPEDLPLAAFYLTRTSHD